MKRIRIENSISKGTGVGKCLVHSGRSCIIGMVSGNGAGKSVRDWMTTKVVLEQINGHTTQFG